MTECVCDGFAIEKALLLFELLEEYKSMSNAQGARIVEAGAAKRSVA